MKRINDKDINSVEYWDKHIAEPDFGLRQRKYLEMAGEGEKIVELGCGMSPFLDKARDNFKEAHGLDFSLKTIIKCRTKYPEVNYIIGDARKTPYYDKEFDVSIAGELIEHLEDPMSLIDEMKRITKKKIILSTAKMEYNDKEHLWQFEEDDFIGQVEAVESKRFPGRSYLFVEVLL